MDLLWFLVSYLTVAISIVVIVMVGEGASPHSCLGRAYYCLAVLPCSCGTWCLRKSCGEGAVKGVDCMQDLLCNKPNPALQILYAGFLGGSYWLYSTEVFPLLPGPLASDIHIHTGTATLMSCFMLMLMCSVFDSGVPITAANAARLCRVYKYGLAPSAPPRSCHTCELPKPSRSKHCSVCNRCITRFDHHCGWINSCVGSHNLRFFLMFLAANTFLCFYAVTVALLAVWGDAMRNNATPVVRVINYQTGDVMLVDRGWTYAVKWIFVRHSLGVSLTLFLGCMGLMLGGFLSYHLWLVARNTTTYEQIKLGRLRKAKEAALASALDDESAAAEAAAAAGGAGGEGSDCPISRSGTDAATEGRARGEGAPPEGDEKHRSPRGEPSSSMGALCRALGLECHPSPYDRGLWSNLEEALLPEVMHKRFGGCGSSSRASTAAEAVDKTKSS